MVRYTMKILGKVNLQERERDRERERERTKGRERGGRQKQK